MKAIPNAIFFAEVERLISEGREVRLTVNGTSMMPFLESGRDTVTLAPFTDDELTEGRIVLFRYRGGHVLHRIVRRSGEVLAIQGDSVHTTETASTADVVAVVREVIRENGRVVPSGSRQWNAAWRRDRLRKRLRRFLSRVKKRISG